MKIVDFGIPIAAGILATAIQVNGQQTAPVPKGEPPLCKPMHRESPDRHWVLTSDAATCRCFGKESKAYNMPCRNGFALTLLDQRTRQTRQIDFDGYAGNAEWSPDSSVFFVNVSVVSNEGDAFLVRADSLQKVDLRTVIPQFDSSLSRYLGDHSYFIVRKWVGEGAALVQVCGHISERRWVQFDFRYRVALDGRISSASKGMGSRHLECTYP